MNKTREQLMAEFIEAYEKVEKVAREIFTTCDYEPGRIEYDDGRITEANVFIGDYIITARDYEGVRLSDDSKIIVEIPMSDIKLRQELIDEAEYKRNLETIEYYKRELGKCVANNAILEAKLKAK